LPFDVYTWLTIGFTSLLLEGFIFVVQKVHKFFFGAKTVCKKGDVVLFVIMIWVLQGNERVGRYGVKEITLDMF